MTEGRVEGGALGEMGKRDTGSYRRVLIRTLTRLDLDFIQVYLECLMENRLKMVTSIPQNQSGSNWTRTSDR